METDSVQGALGEGDPLRALVSGLGARLHLDRVKAQEQLQKCLDQGQWEDDPETLCSLCALVRDLVDSDLPEQRLGGLQASALLISHLDNPEFRDFVFFSSKRLLEDPEVRIRLAVGDCLEALSKRVGVPVYEEIGPCLVESIRLNLDRQEEDEEDADNVASDPSDELDQLLASAYKVMTPGKGELRHGTEGWKCLETSFKALHKVMAGCGHALAPLISSDVRELLYIGLAHPNRFVRETGFHCLGTMCEMMGSDGLADIKSEVASKLATGLGDNWSQVRYAASIATRAFMEVLGAGREDVYAEILPQMCLNRYYVAEGVKFYSQQTWRLVMADHGREWVAKLVQRFVDYYVQQCGANNHAVREAACSCIAELMMKINREAVCGFVPQLLGALVNCFKDASWPVRDAACTACGHCVVAFPEESRAVLDELYDLWFAHLWDNIGSVRENSAISLANAIRAYGDEAVDRILPVLKERLLKAKEQPPDSSQFPNLENVTTFGVAAPRALVTDEARVTDQQMFSCGSLAPKLQRGGGCMDHGFSREKQPWEASDGAVYLVRELSGVRPEAGAECLPAIADLARLGGFTHCHSLHYTIWKVVPTIAKNLGKRTFKRYLEDLLEVMFESLRSGHQLEAAAAGEAIGAVRDMLGPNIFRGRLTDQQAQVLDTDQNIPPVGMSGNQGREAATFPVH